MRSMPIGAPRLLPETILIHFALGLLIHVKCVPYLIPPHIHRHAPTWPQQKGAEEEEKYSHFHYKEPKNPKSKGNRSTNFLCRDKRLSKSCISHSHHGKIKLQITPQKYGLDKLLFSCAILSAIRLCSVFVIAKSHTTPQKL